MLGLVWAEANEMYWNLPIGMSIETLECITKWFS